MALIGDRRSGGNERFGTRNRKREGSDSTPRRRWQPQPLSIDVCDRVDTARVPSGHIVFVKMNLCVPLSDLTWPVYIRS